jgi:uncharacterized coiled-coil protein SlyX
MFWRKLIGLNFPSAAQETIDEAAKVIASQREEIERLNEKLCDLGKEHDGLMVALEQVEQVAHRAIDG